MTKPQAAKYWRRWGSVCRANGWSWKGGRLADGAVREASEHHRAVWRLAEERAEAEVRAVAADDLRHACHIYAAGRDVGHARMENHELTRLLLLWGDERIFKGLLIEPDDVMALAYWMNPGRARREFLVRAIRGIATEDYTAAITSDMWGTIYWEDLPEVDLVGLLQKLHGRMG